MKTSGRGMFFGLGNKRAIAGFSRGVLLAVVFVLTLAYFSCRGRSKESDQPPAGKPVVARMEVQGKEYEIIDGAAYQVDTRSGKYRFIQRLYDPDFYEKNYRKIDGKIYHIGSGGGKKYAVRTSLREGFEGAKSLHDLIGIDREWTSITLQGPGSATVAEYVKLKKRILDRQSDFLDNRIEPSGERSHSGKQSLRLYAVPASWKMQLTKASLDTELFHFVKGDHFWFSGWFFLERGRPTTIMDLECSLIEQGPGMRILFTEQLRPYLELKWLDKPTFKPAKELDVVFARNRWVHVQVHLYLSEKEDGVAELWLDGKKVIEGKGQTLPFDGVVYDRMELGITANPKKTTTILYVDDVTVSPTGWLDSVE